MMHSTLLKFLLAPFFLSAVEGEGGGGGEVDRGDEFVATDEADDTAAAAADAKAEAEEIAAAIAAAKENKKAKEAEADEKAAAKEKGSKADTRIPAARHKEILERERAAREAVETELAKYKQGKEISATNDEINAAETKLGTLESEYNKHLADGALDKASVVMKEIRLTERGISDKKSDMNIAAAEARAVDRARFDTTVDRLEEAYPQIRPGSDEYDQTVVAEMLEMQSAFAAKGYSPSQALQKAVSYILKPTTTKQEKAVSTEARVSEEDKAKAVKEQRKADAVAKALEAEGKTPPETSKVGKDSDKAGGGIVDAKAVMKMSQSDFAKLDEATLSRLRGDTL